jgi:hypothetical protein
MRSLKFAPLQAAVVFALGVVFGSGILGGFAPRTHEISEPAITASVKAPCTSDDAVADFVCRNTWMGQHQYSYR